MNGMRGSDRTLGDRRPGKTHGRDQSAIYRHGRHRNARVLLLDLEAAEILGGRGMARAPESGCGPADVAEVVALRLGAEPPHGHVVDQSLAKRADRADRNKFVHRSTPLLREPTCSDRYSDRSIERSV